MKPQTRAVLIRLVITFAVSMAFGFAVSEGSYRLSRSSNERIPQVISIVIPDGTAGEIARGMPGPQLPVMNFVEGDQIVVVNLDQVSHQLGPLWVPPGMSSSLTLDRPAKYNMDCSFQPEQTVSIDVLPRAQTSDKVVGSLAVGLPTWVLLALYTIVAMPLPGARPETSES